MVSRVEALQKYLFKSLLSPIVIGLTATVSVITFIFISPMHSFLITLSMILTLCIVPWLSAKKHEHSKDR